MKAADEQRFEAAMKKERQEPAASGEAPAAAH